MSTRPTITLAAAPVTLAAADTTARTVTGLAVPFGQAAEVGFWGKLTFDATSLVWAGDVSRVKFLEQHDHERSHGVATSLRQDATGLHATFTVAEGPEGDRLLAEVADGRRDGLSVGVTLDDDFLDRWIAAFLEESDEPLLATGQLREVSACSIPAFDDARATTNKEPA